MTLFRTLMLAAAMLAPTSVLSADPLTTDRHARAQAAGLRALYLCTGLFTAGVSAERLEADIFGNVGGGIAFSPEDVIIQSDLKQVQVRHARDMPPRIAVWRPHLGCVQLPVGAATSAGFPIPRLPADLAAPNFDAQPWPQGDARAIRTLPPAQAERLNAVVGGAFGPKTYAGITWAVIVLKDGKIVAERYERGYDKHTPQRTNSAAKSMAATLVGIAAGEGLVDVKAAAPFPEWRAPGDPRGDITVENLLHMGSGLYTERGGNPQQELYRSGAPAAERSLLNFMDSPPGARFVYAGSDTILALRSVRVALNDDQRFLAYPFDKLFWRIGMTRTTPETDWKGDFLMSGQLWSTARDFARFGLLYSQDGIWNGQRVLPAGWARYVSTPAPAQPSRPDGRGYGAQFWLFGPRQGLPDGVYAAAGARGQYVVIVPTADVVIVRRGFDATSAPFDIAAFSRDVLAALGTGATGR
ncbi:MAG: serine hydrolase [Phenylobacterium sp.]|nr:serine hydrolase [Phenylobacterium sp.]